MKARVYFSIKLPFSITLYPFVLLNQTKQEAIESHTLQHEFVHVAQVRRLGLFKFYFDYLMQFFRTGSYDAISYEVEAYNEESTAPMPELDENGVEQ